MKRFSLLLILSLTVSSVFATPLKLNYSLFFGYMKTLYKLQYEDVTTAFYLRENATGAACLIKQAEIVVDNKREPIKFTEQGRLLPFYSDQHRKDGAMIEVQLLAAQSNAQCDLQVTLMAKETALDNLSLSRLAVISAQLEGLLNKNAGMVAKYFLPTYSGIRLQLATPLTTVQLSQLDKQIEVAENGDLFISKEFLAIAPLDKPITFKVSRVTPWLNK